VKENKKKEILINIFFILIIILILVGANIIFDKYNFNEYYKAEDILKGSVFERDPSVKYSDMNSYKIYSDKENDALFYRTIEVEPETPYKITCMIKTNDVKSTNEKILSGAHISIVDTTERSKLINGSNGWQKVELLFDSKDRTSIDIGFRLGGYEGNCSGTAWFSDFTIEKGIKSNENNWNMALFIIENIDVNVNIDEKIENIKLSMNNQDIYQMEKNIKNFDESIRSLSNENIISKSDVYKIEEPLTSLSYDETNGYYVGPNDVELLIDTYIDKKEYDHIFVAVRLGDVMKNTEIPVYDWIGLRSYGLLWYRFF